MNATNEKTVSSNLTSIAEYTQDCREQVTHSHTVPAVPAENL